jgi:hypothetical protein
VDWETYLGWHYNHGAVLVAINTGATGQELPDLLEKSAFGQEALAAYHKFLAGVRLREKPVTETPELRLQRKMVKLGEAETVLEEALRRLAAPPAAPGAATTGK